MNILRNMKVGAKLALAFAAVLALTGSLAAVSLVKLGGVEHQWHKVEFVDMVKDASLAKAGKALLEAEIDVKNYLLKGGDYAKKANDEVTMLEKALGEYRAAGHITPKEDELMKGVSEGAKAYHVAIGKAIEMRAANVPTTEIDKVVHVAEEAIEKPLHALDELSIAETKAASKVLDALISSARLWVWALTGLALVLGALFAFLISRAITRPLKQAVMVAEAVAAGDLTKNVEATSNDEAGALINARQ